MSNSPLPISLLPNVQSTGLTSNDLLVVVNYDVPSGTTKNITTDDFKTYITSGITNSFTGGTVSGSTEFTDGLTANTLNVNGVNITGDYLPLSGGVMDDNAIIQFDNYSQLREGTYDFGGQGGISQICGVGYENNWQSGINHIFDSNGFIRESSHCFNIIPDNTFDSSLRFKVGSRWILDNGDIYVCSDNNINTAVWDLEINDTYVTGGTYYTGGTIIFDYNTGSDFEVSGLTEDLNNAIASLAEADEETIELNLTTNKIQLKEIVAEATGGTRTFQGDFAISGGTLNLDTIGSGSPIINLGLDSSGFVVTGTTSIPFTGNTSGDCISDIYVSNLYGCSPITIHDSIQNLGSTASGVLSTAFGDRTTASGDYSHAEGYGTIASGTTSHAEGSSTIASGTSSHAEGYLTTANGNSSHAEGDSTRTIGTASHAEGNNTIAGGEASHAEGTNTTANGNSSHAGGDSSTASGKTSFVHSTNSIVIGERSVVLGGQNITGTTNDTVYVPYLNIKYINSGTSITNLGVDSSGNVVTGTTDQTVTITGGTNIEIVGSYPDFGINFTGDTFTGLTVGVTQITSGTSGSILFEGSGNVLQESTSLVWDNTNSTLGIGASPSSATTLDVRSKDVLTTSIPFRVRNNANTVNFLTVNNYGEVFSNGLVGTTSNTFFGEGNGRSITTGGSNTSFGYNTFFSNNTGAGNSVFGTSSLLNNLSGNFNSAFGSNALQVNIIGNNNSAFGSNALLNNTDNNNSAFGFEALKNNTTGQKNTAVGQGSLVANLSGINNTAVGANSLQSNTTGIENISVGRNSLFSSITGSSNTSIGVNSLAHVTIGGSNIALGNDAGRRKSNSSNLGNTTSSIFIGVDTKASDESQTNQIVIGHNAVGLGSNTTVIGNSSTTLFRPYGNVLVDGTLSATTISATTYNNLPVSGLTEGNNISLTNNSGNYTVAVTGITNPINTYFNAGSGATLNWNVSGQSTNYDITLTATTTLNLSNVRNGEYGTIIVRQDGVGGRTITLGTINGSGGTHRVANGGGGSIILTSNASAIDILTFTYNGSIMFWTVGNDYT